MKKNPFFRTDLSSMDSNQLRNLYIADRWFRYYCKYTNWVNTLVTKTEMPVKYGGTGVITQYEDKKIAKFFIRPIITPFFYFIASFFYKQQS
jgi:hypothetical protein